MSIITYFDIQPMESILQTHLPIPIVLHCLGLVFYQVTLPFYSDLLPLSMYNCDLRNIQMIFLLKFTIVQHMYGFIEEGIDTPVISHLHIKILEIVN